jgi:ketosteroid isomerase-like protein
MNRIVLIVFVLSFTNPWNTFGQSDVDTIKKLNLKWVNSYVTKDKATLDAIFADDFVLINPKGIKTTKQDNLTRLSGQETLSVNVDSVDVRLVSKDVGVLTAYITFVMNSEGKKMTGRNCYQDVYVKRKSRWYAVSAHVTLLSLE